VARRAPRPRGIVLVISDRSSAGGLARAQRRGILPCRIPADSAAIFAALEGAGAELAILGGFLRLLRVPPRWLGRVLNIHPSLIPRHAGPGFYGDRVHRSVLAAREPESGCTAHFVDDAYDHGPVIDRGVVPVGAGDDAETLAARVFEMEQIVYPRAIERVLRGEVAFAAAGGAPRPR
jgi:phosphoribosylglycinamide formyltransferase-1